MLVHHLTVVTCFGIAAVSRTYVAYAAISLVVEVNSVFLHGRQLLKFAGCTQTLVRTGGEFFMKINFVAKEIILIALVQYFSLIEWLLCSTF